MPILRAVRPPSKQCLGDLLFDVLKKQYGDLASKLVGLLLEGKTEGELAASLESSLELERIVGGVLRLLSVQRGIPEPDSLEKLGAVLRKGEPEPTSEDHFQRASAAWSLADLAMEEKWRLEIGKRNDILCDLILLVCAGSVHEKKNAALCLGNLCCDCATNQVILASMLGVEEEHFGVKNSTPGTPTADRANKKPSLVDGLIRMMDGGNDETSRMFACLAMNNLACLYDASRLIGRHEGCLRALVSMLNSNTEEGRQCSCLAIANMAANDPDNDLELSLADGVLPGLLEVLGSTGVAEVEETASWAISILCCRDELNTFPLFLAHGGWKILCPLIRRACHPGGSSLQCVRYAVQILQTGIEVLGSCHLSHDELVIAFDALLALANSFEIERQECAAVALASLAAVPCSPDGKPGGAMSMIMKRPRMLCSFMSVITHGTSIAAAAIAQTIADYIDLLAISEEKLAMGLYLLNVARLQIPLEARIPALVQTLRGNFVADDGRSVFFPQCSNLKIVLDRENLLFSALRSLGTVPAQTLLSNGYQIVFRSTGVKEVGVDHGGLRRVALSQIASTLFDPSNGFVVDCLGSDGRRSGMVQLNPSTKLDAIAIRGHHDQNEAVYRLMGRIIALALAEGVPLGVSLPRSFCKMLLIDTMHPETICLDDLRDHDEQLHRSLAIVLPTLPEPELRFALAEQTFSIPSSRIMVQEIRNSEAQRSSINAVATAFKSPGPQPSQGDVDAAGSPFARKLQLTPPTRRTEVAAADAAVWMSPLRPGGEGMAVTPSSFSDYTSLVAHKRLVSDVVEQMECVRTGLKEVSKRFCGSSCVMILLVSSSLSLLKAEDLQHLLKGETLVDTDQWKANTKYVSGAVDEQVCEWFWEYVDALDNASRLNLVQWITGLRSLPHGGIAALHHFTILVEDGAPNGRLPSVSTCSFSLCIPCYTSYKVLSEKFDKAILETQFARA